MEAPLSPIGRCPVNVVRPTLHFAAFSRCVLFLKAVASLIGRQNWLRSEPLSRTSGGLHAGLVSRDTRADR